MIRNSLPSLFRAGAAPVILALWLAACNGDPPPRFTGPLDADSLFQAVVVPLLAAECESCHLAGGELYTTLPFDSRAAVEARADEIALRKEGDGRRILEAWIRWSRESDRP